MDCSSGRRGKQAAYIPSTSGLDMISEVGRHLTNVQVNLLSGNGTDVP